MRAKNPTTKIPFLELDDGTCIGETTAICRYFEELNPENPLMGRTPLEKAQVEMWQRRVEFHFMLPIGMCFQDTSGYFKDRMKPIAEWGKVSGENAIAYFNELNKHFKTSTYLVGDYFSIADINLLCAIDFARVVKIRPSEEYTYLLAWYKKVSARPCAVCHNVEWSAVHSLTNVVSRSSFLYSNRCADEAVAGTARPSA